MFIAVGFPNPEMGLGLRVLVLGSKFGSLSSLLVGFRGCGVSGKVSEIATV